MRRGTTPTLVINIKGIEMSDIAEWYITVAQDSTQITKSNDDITIEDTLLKMPLSQEETMRFKSGEVSIQIRAKTTEDVVIASGIQTIDIDRILYNEVI